MDALAGDTCYKYVNTNSFFNQNPVNNNTNSLNPFDMLETNTNQN